MSDIVGQNDVLMQMVCLGTPSYKNKYNLLLSANRSFLGIRLQD